MRNTKLEELLAKYPAEAEVYLVFESKPDGSKRPIAKQNESLNKWLKRTKKELYLLRKDWPDFMHGGVKKRSYISFARPHTNKKTVISIDIRDCFGSINQKHVQDVLVSRLNLSIKLAGRLASKLCYKGRLPQGYATSNFLTNLYLSETLLYIKRQLRKAGADMTIYVDDIAISGQNLNCGNIINLVVLELSRAGLSVSKAKIKVMHAHDRQVLCGLIVNKGISLTRRKKKQLLSDVANGRISEASLIGWIANLKVIDKRFMNKLEAYASHKGILLEMS